MTELSKLLSQLKTIDEAQLTCVAQWHDKEPESLPEDFAGLVAGQSLQKMFISAVKGTLAWRAKFKNGESSGTAGLTTIASAEVKSSWRCWPR